MPLGDTSNPARFLQGQHATDQRNLSLKVFGGEVLAAFDLNVLMADKHETKTIAAGAKSAQFPKTWKATSEYHSPGVELLGTDIDTTEVVITVDDILVSHTAISDIDDMLSHFDVRGKYSDAMGFELSKVFDKNVFRQLILNARESADGPFPAGNTITDASLTNSGAIDGKAWVDALRQASRDIYNVNVPASETRYAAVNAEVFDAIKYATDANGNYLLLNRDFGAQASVGGKEERLQIEDITVYRSRNMPTANETSVTSVHAKYRANYSTTTGVVWTPMGVGTVKVMNIGFEGERDVRRLEDFLVAKMLVGHGKLRPECAMELKTS